MASIAKFDQWQNSAGVNYNTIIQVVEATNSAITSASGVGVTIECVSCAITPKFSTSKILIMYGADVSTSNNQQSTSWLTRNGTKIGTPWADSPSYGGIASASQGGGYSPGDQHSTMFGTFLDSPGTTSSITYAAIAGCRRDDSRGIRLNLSWNYTSYSYGWQLPGVCRMTLMEIAA